jgi:hypothetical protein
MQEPRSFASLSSTLLARKGQARPAMRPQGFTQPSMLEDLGWNDMGVVPERPVVMEAGPESVQPVLPPVVQQQAAIAEELNAPVEAYAEPVVEEAPAQPVMREKQPRRKQAAVVRTRTESTSGSVRARPGSKAKAAFTLRLDPDRHLKLRLACAIGHRSAQMVVIEALDHFLNAMPELDTMAAHARHR